MVREIVKHFKKLIHNQQNCIIDTVICFTLDQSYNIINKKKFHWFKIISSG